MAPVTDEPRTSAGITRSGSFAANGIVERFSEVLHAGFEMKVVPQEQAGVSENVADILKRAIHRGDCPFQKALVTFAGLENQGLMILIKNDPVLGAE